MIQYVILWRLLHFASSLGIHSVINIYLSYDRPTEHELFTSTHWIAFLGRNRRHFTTNMSSLRSSMAIRMVSRMLLSARDDSNMRRYVGILDLYFCFFLVFGQGYQAQATNVPRSLICDDRTWQRISKTMIPGLTMENSRRAQEMWIVFVRCMSALSLKYRQLRRSDSGDATSISGSNMPFLRNSKQK